MTTRWKTIATIQYADTETGNYIVACIRKSNTAGIGFRMGIFDEAVGGLIGIIRFVIGQPRDGDFIAFTHYGVGMKSPGAITGIDLAQYDSLIIV